MKTKRTINTICLLAALLLPTVPPCLAQDGVGVLRLSLGSRPAASAPEASKAALKELDRVLEGGVVDSVLAEGWSSPDGTAAGNAKLSGRRASAALSSLMKRGIPTGVRARVVARGEDWSSVADFVRSTDDASVTAFRESILFLIENETEPDRREEQLRLRYAEAWKAVEKGCYEAARRADVTIWYHNGALVDTLAVTAEDIPMVWPSGRSGAEAPEKDSVAMDIPSIAAPSLAPARDTASGPVAVLEGEPFETGVAPVPASYDRTWRVAPRSNLFVPLMNVGLGIACGPKGRFMIGADWYYPWSGSLGNGSWCVEVLAAELSARWYFRDGTDPYSRATGFWLGLDAMATLYDLCLHSKGFQGEGLAGGLAFGWTFPVGKGHLRMGLEMTVGYAYLQNRRYDVFEGTAFREGDFMRTIGWWGPLKAAWTLEVPIWCNVSK